MKPISNRYVREDFIISPDKGRLYRGKDLSLQRTVFIYTVPHQGIASAQAYLQKIGSSAQVTNNSSYMHVFDVEMDHETIYIIMKYIEGRSLQQVMPSRPYSYEEASAFVAGIGRTLTEIAVERPLNFSISPNNLWIQDTGQVTLINTWDTSATNGRLSKELGGILYRLLTQSELLPADSESLRNSLQQSSLLDGLDSTQKKAAVTAVADAYEDRLSALAFIQFLEEGSPASNAGEPEEKNTEAYTGSITYENKDNRENQMERRISRAWSSQPVTKKIERSDHADTLPATLLQTVLSKRVWKRMSLVLSLGLLSVAVFIGVFAVLIESTGQKENPFKSSGAPSAQTLPPPPVQEKVQHQEEVRTAKKPAAADNEAESNISIPTLTGLSKEAAEQQALASGFRYTYYLETSQQAAGTVFKQEPMPHEQAAKGSRVVFWISKGSPAP